MRISKSKFVAGAQCLKRLYLQVHQPELAAEPDASGKAIMDQGQEVGLLAHRLFPGGVKVEGSAGLEQAIRATRELVANREVPAIFEATFEHGDVLVRTDVLKRSDRGFDLTEVKSSTKVKPEHTDDVSIQKYVMGGCGLKVSNMNVMHLSRDYVYDGTLGVDGRRVYDISRLFAAEEVQPHSDGLVSRTLDEQFKMLGQPQPPNVEPSTALSTHCQCICSILQGPGHLHGNKAVASQILRPFQSRYGSTHRESSSRR